MVDLVLQRLSLKKLLPRRKDLRVSEKYPGRITGLRGVLKVGDTFC